MMMMYLFRRNVADLEAKEGLHGEVGTGLGDDHHDNNHDHLLTRVEKTLLIPTPTPAMCAGALRRLSVRTRGNA